MDTPNLCQCGCGKPTTLITKSNAWNGQVAGTYRKYLVGHAGRKPLPTQDTIKNNVEIDENGCWIWTGAKDTTGYGYVNVKRKKVSTHRLTYTLFTGEIPEGMQVCHTCDVRMCCNPSHLFLGTIADNMKDKAVKGRAVRGEVHHSAKLNEEKVRLILKSNDSTANLARQFSVSERAITFIRNRKNWRHITI